VALSNYSDLVSAVGDWLARSDLAARSPDFIALAEARINRELRVREMLDQVSSSVSEQTIALPSDFLEVYRLTLDTENDVPLEYRPIEDSELRVAGLTSGQPMWFSILGDDIQLYPAPDGTYDYTLDYYARVPALTSSATTNWLMTKAPDLYLFGALCEAESFLQNDERIAIWEAKFQAAKRSLNGADQRAKRSSAPRRMRVVS
jgi:hypothetical protein